MAFAEGGNESSMMAFVPLQRSNVTKIDDKLHCILKERFSGPCFVNGFCFALLNMFVTKMQPIQSLNVNQFACKFRCNKNRNVTIANATLGGHNPNQGQKNMLKWIDSSALAANVVQKSTTFKVFPDSTLHATRVGLLKRCSRRCV